jgi:superfamily II DNA or RNA helicase
MIDAISSMLGNITVKIEKGFVEIAGMRSSFLQNDLRKLYGTARVFDNMFDVGRYSLRFPEFFLPDFFYVISDAIKNKNRYGTPIHTLAQIQELLISETWLGDTQKEHPTKLNWSALSKFKITPKDFQEEFFKVYDQTTQRYKLKGMLFAGSAGSGKTFGSIALTELLESDFTIVVSPKNALNTAWEDNINKHYKSPPPYWVCTSSARPTGYERFVIVNYEYLEKLIELLPMFRYKKLTILLDESHNLNEITALRTTRLIQLCVITDCQDVVWLSGTPIKAIALEAIPLIRCIDPRFTPEAERRFRGVFRGDNSRATSILSNRIGLISFKVEKERLQLAAPIFHSMKVSFKGSEKYTLTKIKEKMKLFIEERAKYYAERKEEDHKFFNFWLRQHELSLRGREAIEEFQTYKACLQNVISSRADASAKNDIVFCNKYEKQKIAQTVPQHLRAQFLETCSIVKYVHLKIQGECLGRVVGRARIDCHVEMAKYLDILQVCESTKKKTVIFSSYVEVVEEAEKRAIRQELTPVLVYAKTNSNLNEIVAKFGMDETVNPLIATYASLSTAVPLVMADTMLMIDTPFRDYILQQAVSRIHRLGADTQTHVYTTTLDTGEEPNISTRTLDILKWSQQQIEQIVGVKSPFEIKEDGESISVAMESYIAEFEHDEPDLGSFEVANPLGYAEW